MKTETQKLAIDVPSSVICNGGFSGSCTAANDSKVMLQIGIFDLNTSYGIKEIPPKTLSMSGLSG